MLKLQDGCEPGCPLPFCGPPMYVFEDPERNGELEQDLMMELDYRTCMLRCVCVCMPRYKCVFVCSSTCCYLLQIGLFSCMYMPFVTCLL